MVTTTADNVVVNMDVQNSRYNQKMAETERTFDNAMGNMERRAVRSSEVMRGVFQGLGQGIVAELRKLPAAIGEIVSEMARIPEVARAAGVSIRELQQLRFNASRNNVSASDFDKGLNALTSGLATEFREGETNLGKLLEANNIKIKDRNGNLRATMDILREISQLAKDAENIGDPRRAEEIRAKIAEMLGVSREWLRAIEQGPDALNRNMTEAERLGVVLDEATIKKAKEFEDGWRAAWLEFNTIGQAQIAGIAQGLSSLINKAAEFIRGWNELNSGGGPVITATRGGIRLENDPDGLGRNDGRQLYNEPIGPGRPANAPTVSTGGARGGRVPNIPDTSRSRGGGGSQSEREDSYERMNRRLEERIALLNAETAAQSQVNPLINDYGFTLEKARAVQKLLNAAKKEEMDITPELMANIDRLATTYANATVAANRLASEHRKLKKAADEFNSGAKDVLKGFISDIKNGKSAVEALAGALNKIADKLIDMAVNGLFDFGKNSGGLFGWLFGGGSGGGGGLFSNLFGGFRAGGGSVQAGKAYVVGENRPELFVPDQSGHIIPDIPSFGSNSAGNQFTFAPVIDASGADVAAVARLESAVARMYAEWDSRTVQSVKTAQKRRMI